MSESDGNVEEKTNEGWMHRVSEWQTEERKK